MKQGLTGIKVGWAVHELKVSVATDKKRYQVRENMTVKVKATSVDRDVKALGPAAEVALFVVDESVGLLRKNWTTDLLLAMMSPRGLAVGTSTSQSMVVGKRHFGSKGKPPGGGGGAQTDARELSDPVVFWQGRVKLNANGEAQVVVPLKDAISRFSVVAVVSNGLGQFGTGQTSIEATRDLIIYSGFAPVVHRGDSVDQEVTIRNTTNRVMTVDVSIDKIGGGPVASAKAHSSSVQLKGSSATAIRVPLAVPEGDVTSTAADEYLVTAKERGGVAEDRLKVKTSVEATVPPRVLQATLFQIEKSGTKLDIKQPADAMN